MLRDRRTRIRLRVLRPVVAIDCLQSASAVELTDALRVKARVAFHFAVASLSILLFFAFWIAIP